MAAKGIERASPCFSHAYNLASRLKTLKDKSPYDFIKNIWTLEPDRFTFDQNHFNMGLNA